MAGKAERAPEESSSAGSEVITVPSNATTLSGLVQRDGTVGDEAMRRIAGGIGAYLHAFRRHWLPATSAGLLCGVAAIIPAWILTAERHTAVAMLRISANEKPLVFPTAERTTAYDFEIYKGTQQQLLTSDVVLAAALRRPEVASLAFVEREDNPARWLARNLRVELPLSSEIMRVSLTTSRPDEAAILVEAVVDAYMAEVVNAERRRQLDRLNDLDRLYTEKEAEMRKRRTELKQLAEKLGTGDTGALALRQQIAMQQYAEARNELSRLRSELQRAEDDLQGKLAWVKVLESAPTPHSNPQAATDPMLTRLAERIEQIDEWLAVIREKLKEPLLSQMSARYMETKKALVEKMAQREKELDSTLHKAKQENQSPEIVELKSRVDVLKAQVKAAAIDLDEQRVNAERFGNSSIDVEMMRSELQYLDKVLAPIADERERLKVELRWTPRITVFQRAEPPKTPDGRPRLWNAATAGICGFLVPILLVLSWDARKQKINSLTDLSRGLGLTVIGVVPLPGQETGRAGRDEKNLGKCRNSFDHALDSIVARLFFRKDAEDVRVVMVTSATAGEGKTVLAVQLATRLAHAGRPTLLVDYDLRRPSIHQIFGMPPGPGIAGPDAGAREGFRRQIAHAGLDACVHLVAPLYGDKKYAALRSASCFCLPSRQEGFSIAILEAMACRIPVIISDACHFSEVAEAGAGHVVALDPKAIASALRNVLQNPAAKQRMGDAGFRLVQSRYTWPKIAERAVRAYRQIITKTVA